MRVGSRGAGGEIPAGIGNVPGETNMRRFCGPQEFMP